ncbi:MAG TPA: protein kinase [Terriglobales bacterium]|nr:protein kinase [Terriglobales bacterium]
MAAPNPIVGPRLSHYRILEQIGAGGMGVVYRARDEQLERDVAIKVLPTGMLADENSRKRFRKEALSLARLNHPNIATIFEFGTQDGTDFLVTEYIPGITLDTKLQHGPLTSKEVTTLGAQLAQGLAAAHDQGVIHRDLKPGNLRLTPDGRLKILDFGLAHHLPRANDLGATLTLTEAHQLTTGTPPYMAPEQLRGEAPHVRTDIWSAGVVLYEMATGKRPFPETTGPMLIDAILNREPEPPGKINRQVSPGLETVILKALDKDPTRRYQTSRELGIDLERLTAGISPLAKPRWAKKWTLTAGLVVVALVLAIGGYFLHQRKSSEREAATSATKARRSVAVIGFKNLSSRPEHAWLSTALSEMLTTELGAGEQLRTVPGESVSRMKANLSLPDTESLAGETLARVYRSLGSTLVVLGSYLDIDGQVRVDLRVQNATNGETVATLTDTGTEAQIFVLVNRLGTQLRGKCGAGSVSPSQAAALEASHPANPEAARLYADGLARLRSFDALGARDLLLKAVAEEPDFALSHAALGSAWQSLGYQTKAKEQVQMASDLGASLSREDRLAIQGQSYSLNGQYDKAVETYRALFGFFPDNLDYGLRLATEQMNAGKPKDAFDTLSGLRTLPSPMRDDARIDLEQALAAELLGDHKQQLALTEQAIKKGLETGDRLSAAAALMCERRLYAGQGDTKRAEAVSAQAKRLFVEAGNKDSAAGVVFSSGIGAMNAGDRVGARNLFEQALVSFREVGDETGGARALQILGRINQESGDLAHAKPISDQVIATYRKVDAKRLLTNALWQRGELLMQLGDYKGAKASLNESLDIARTAGPRSMVSSVLMDMAGLNVVQGNIRDARAQYEQSIAEAKEHFKVQVPSISMGLARVLLLQGDLAGAQRLDEELLKSSEDSGEKEGAAWCEYLLAEVALEAGRWAEAESLARKAADGLTELGSADEEPYALGILARALLRQGKVTEAQESIAKEQALSRNSQDVGIQMEVGTSAARVQAASGKPEAAVASLNALIARATKLGCVSCTFEARLALGEIELESGRPTPGRTPLRTLEREAKSRGFILTAQRAAAARK